MGGIFNNIYDKGRGPGKYFLAENEAGTVSGRNKSIILPTVLKVSTEELEYWTNMTCLYDKQWNFNPKLSTVPLCFFHITSVREITTARTAEKRVVVYQAPKGSGGIPEILQSEAYRANAEVIMDNIVVQPKMYQMEVIIPDSLIGPFHKQGLNRLEALTQYMSLTETGPSFVDTIGNALRGAQIFLDSVEKVMSLADLILGAAQTGSTQMATLNKNSINAMVGSGHVLCFKKWTGYNYSYGVLTNVDISKKPNEEGVHRGTLTFQETPILNISQRDPKKAASNNPSSISYYASQTARITSLALALPFMKITGVMDEAGAPGTDNNTKTKFFDFSNTTSLF